MKTKTTSQLKKILDKVYSEYIRQKGSVRGYNYCFSCGTRKHWKELQCGHYISRSHLSTRFLEKNTHPQCVACNIFKNGNMDEYALMLQSCYGKDILEILNREKQKIVKDYPYLSQIEHYKKLLSEL